MLELILFLIAVMALIVWFAITRPIKARTARPAPRLPVAANSNAPKLTVEQMLVLDAMSGDRGLTANHISAVTGLPPAQVNRVRRELSQLGLATYGPLYDQDGAGVRGSGYLLSPAGKDTQAELRARTARVLAA